MAASGEASTSLLPSGPAARRGAGIRAAHAVRRAVREDWPGSGAAQFHHTVSRPPEFTWAGLATWRVAQPAGRSSQAAGWASTQWASPFLQQFLIVPTRRPGRP